MAFKKELDLISTMKKEKRKGGCVEIRRRKRYYMKKYMLIIVTDREMDEPQFYETKEEAQMAMWTDFVECMGIGVDETKEWFVNDKCEADAQVGNDFAWANIHHSNYDWTIIDLGKYCRLDSGIDVC